MVEAVSELAADCITALNAVLHSGDGSATAAQGDDKTGETLGACRGTEGCSEGVGERRGFRLPEEMNHSDASTTAPISIIGPAPIHGFEAFIPGA